MSECPIISRYVCECDILSKGEYYIGDPCYAIGESDTHWRNICEVMFDSDKNTSNVSARWNQDKKDGKDLENYGLQISKPYRKQPRKKKPKYYDVAIYGTDGDGSYEDVESSTGEYYVDAGIIGAIPIEIIPKNDRTRENGEWNIWGGHIINFTDDVHCFTDGEYLHFGYKGNHIAIDIDPGSHDQEALSAYYDKLESVKNW